MITSLRTLGIAWLLLVSTPFSSSASQTPADKANATLEPRAKVGGTAGFGLELEIRRIELTNVAIPIGESSAEQLKQIKGAAMQGEDYDKHPQWMLSAEQSTNSIRNVVPEFIINGETVGLGNGDVDDAVGDIVRYMDDWKPAITSPQNQIVIKGFETNGKWTITNPSSYTPSLVSYGLQVTISMPLEGIEDLFEDAIEKDSKSRSALIGSPKNLHWVKDTHFSLDGNDKDYPQDFPRVSATADVRAFFSLVLTYAKGTSKYDPNNQSPKMISSIMPRTSFVAMYKIIRPRLEKALACQGLYDILNQLATFDGRGGNDRDLKYSLDKQVFAFRGYDGMPGELPVKGWIEGIEKGIDLLAQADDEYADGQIGKLGDKMEGIYDNPGRQAPIFEFRDLTNTGNSNLQSTVKKLEDAAKALHKTFAKPMRRDVTRVLQDRASETSKACSRCKKGQATTGKNGECEDCPAGKVPSDDQKTCKDDDKKCGDGEAKVGANGDCQKCPAGKVPSDDQTTCNDDKKCGDGEAKVGAKGECQRCPSGKVPAGDGKSCMTNPKAADENKKNGCRAK